MGGAYCIFSFNTLPPSGHAENSKYDPKVRWKWEGSDLPTDLTWVCFWWILSVCVGVRADGTDVGVLARFFQLLQPIDSPVGLPQAVFAIDNRNCHGKSHFWFESTSATPKNKTRVSRIEAQILKTCLKENKNYLELPFARVAFAKFIVFSEEPVAVVTGDLFARFDISENFNASRVAPRWHKLIKERNKKQKRNIHIQWRCSAFPRDVRHALWFKKNSYLAIRPTIWNEKWKV